LLLQLQVSKKPAERKTKVDLEKQFQNELVKKGLSLLFA